MKSISYYLINGLTLYRVIAAPLLIFLAYNHQIQLFIWLLPISFFTDLIDGFLARTFKVTSVIGSRLDSIGDDLTFLAALFGAFIFKFEFILANAVIIGIPMALVIFQYAYALFKFGRLSSFHTYLAKLSTLFQGCFWIALFLLPEPVYFLFYLAIITTFLSVIEEIILVGYLKAWRADVKGLYSLIRNQK